MSGRILYSPLPLLKDYCTSRLTMINNHFLRKALVRKRSQTEFGNAERGKAMAAESELAQEDQDKMYKDLFGQLNRSIHKEQKNASRMLSNFQKTFKKQPMQWSKLLGQVQEKIKAFEPKIDLELPVDDMVEESNKHLQKYLEELIKFINEQSVHISVGYTSKDQSANCISTRSYIPIRIVYEDDFNSAAAYSGVLFWQLEEGKEALDPAQFKKGLRLGYGLTDENGVLKYSLGAVGNSQGKLMNVAQGAVKHGREIRLVNRSTPPTAVSRKFGDVDAYRYLVMDRLSFKKGANSRKDEPQPDYRPEAIGKQMVAKLKNGGEIFRLGPALLTPGKTYCFMLMPHGWGHFQTKDLNQLMKMKVDGKSVVAKVTIPKECADPEYTVPVYCTLPEWSHRIRNVLGKMVAKLEHRSREIAEHAPNQSRLMALKKINELHSKFSYEPLTGKNKSYSTELDKSLDACMEEYKSVIAKDVRGINEEVDTLATVVINMLKSEAFSKEFVHYLDTINKVRRTTTIPPGPYMTVETGWPVIYQTLQDCFLILSQSSKKEELFDLLAVPYLQAITKADDHSRYKLDKALLSRLKTEKPALYELYSGKLPEITVEGDTNVVGYVEAMFKQGIMPVYGAINKMPGPPSFLQSVVYVSSNLFPKFMISNAGENPKFAAIGNTVLYVVQKIVREDNFSNKEFRDFLHLLIAYEIDPGEQVKNQITKKLLSIADVSSAFKYRMFCSATTFVFATMSLYEYMLSTPEEEKDFEHYFKKVAPAFINFSYATINIARVGSKKIHQVLLSKGMMGNFTKVVGKIAGEGVEKFAGRVAYVYSVYTALVYSHDAYERFAVGDIAGGVENVANVVVSIGFFVGEMLLLTGQVHLALIVFAVAIIVQIGIWIWEYIKDPNHVADFMQNVISEFESKKLWLVKMDGKEVDLRSSQFKTDWAKVKDTVDEMQWNYMCWYSIVPLHLLGLDEENIAKLIAIKNPLNEEITAGEDAVFNKYDVYQVLRYFEHISEAVDGELDADYSAQDIKEFEVAIEILKNGDLDKVGASRDYPSGRLPNYSDITRTGTSKIIEERIKLMIPSYQMCTPDWPNAGPQMKAVSP